MRFVLSTGTDESRDFYRKELGATTLVSTNVPKFGFGKWRKLGKSIPSAIRTVEDLESLTVEGVLIGDLVYDAFCKHYGVASPVVGDTKFQSFLREAIYILGFWSRYFARESVTAVIGESVYLQGIPLRVAASRGVPTYVANLTGIERLDHQNPYEDSLFRHYPELARLLPQSELEAGMAQAKRTLGDLLAGKTVKRRNLYDGPSAFAQVREIKSFPRNGKNSVLIVPHDFFDSSHMRGPHLYPDFKVWLWELGKLSREIDVNWYLKPHPRESTKTLEVLKLFGQEFPHIEFLPGDVNPASLAKLGVRAALTVKGTVAGEYPLLGIRVVNASTANFHVRYSFCDSPADRPTYESLLKALKTDQSKPDTKGIFEFFYLRHIFEYHGSFLNPEEIDEIDWMGTLGRGEVWKHYDPKRIDDVQAVVDCFVENEGHWMRGRKAIRLTPDGLRIFETEKVS